MDSRQFARSILATHRIPRLVSCLNYKRGQANMQVCGYSVLSVCSYPGVSISYEFSPTLRNLEVSSKFQISSDFGTYESARLTTSWQRLRDTSCGSSFMRIRENVTLSCSPSMVIPGHTRISLIISSFHVQLCWTLLTS